MKRITVAICLSALFTVPVYADNLCQEEAKALGYEGPIDTLKPCAPQQKADKQANPGQPDKAPEPKDMAQQQEPGTMEQFGQLQIQE